MKLLLNILTIWVIVVGTASAQSTIPGDGLDLPILPPDGPGVAFGTLAPTNGDDSEGEEKEDGDENDDPRDTPPPTIYGEELESENDTIFYVLDISCSMGWDIGAYTSPDGITMNGPRIDRAKAELARSILGLSDNFYFNVIAFDCGTRQWENGMQPADVEHKASALSWVMALRPTGATGTGPATAQALGDKENLMVVLLTDGAPNCGADGLDGHRHMISSANTQGATINVFGIAASGSYRAFCQNVASDSGGSYFDVP